jgi:NAD(P)H-hydrate epimerase
MRLPALTREQVRRVDQIAIEQYGLPGVVLMENAGRGAAEIIHQLAPPGLAVILCGSGNNAGDGYVIARHLELMGHEVRIVSLVEPSELKGDALINARVAENSAIEILVARDRSAIDAAMSGATTIIDCLLGTGAQGGLREPFACAVELANQHSAKLRIAIDIPTGMDCDSGKCGEPTFRADHTITFVARKIGFDVASDSSYLGRVHEVSIGAPLKLLREVFG